MSQTRPDSPIHQRELLSGSDKKAEISYTPGVIKSKSPTADDETHNDIQMVTEAINKPGEDQYSAGILKNVYNLLCHGGLQCYKELKGQVNGAKAGVWKPWDLPFASALCHGSRVLIQFPEQLNDEILEWLFCRKEGNLTNYKRFTATHDIELPNPATKEKNEVELNAEQVKKNLKGSVELNADKVKKILRERKISLFTASRCGVGASMVDNFSYAAGSWLDPGGRHFGINIAMGGAGNTNPFSKNVIHCDGEHGHLYVYYLPGKDGIPGGLLIGIEQSAPRKSDQNGGSHGAGATHHKFSATHGKNFAETDGFEGPGGPDRYHDGMFLNLTVEKFREIQNKRFSLAMLGLYTETASTSLESKSQLQTPPLPVQPHEELKQSVSPSVPDVSNGLGVTIQDEIEGADESNDREEEKQSQRLQDRSTGPTSLSPVVAFDSIPVAENKVKDKEWEETALPLVSLIDSAEPHCNDDLDVIEVVTEEESEGSGDNIIDTTSPRKTEPAPSQKTRGWKIALATVGVLFGIAAVLTGAGALVGVSVLASIAVWAAASIITAGGVTAISSTAYICSKVSCPDQDEQLIDSTDRNKVKASVQLLPPSLVGPRSSSSLKSTGFFSACWGRREKEQPGQNERVQEQEEQELVIFDRSSQL